MKTTADARLPDVEGSAGSSRVSPLGPLLQTGHGPVADPRDPVEFAARAVGVGPPGADDLDTSASRRDLCSERSGSGVSVTRMSGTRPRRRQFTAVPGHGRRRDRSPTAVLAPSPGFGQPQLWIGSRTELISIVPPNGPPFALRDLRPGKSRPSDARSRHQ
jgi:hypothetical protein